MEVKTKFSVGDEIYIMQNGSVLSLIISYIKVVYEKTTTVTYMASGSNYSENVIFTSKQDALQHWVKLQGYECLGFSLLEGRISKCT